jgi:hypothetical protein
MFEHSPLFVPGKAETRWATAENRHALKGGACIGNDGRKRSPCIQPLPAGKTEVLAEASGSSGVVRRIWITIDDRSPAMLRSLRLEIFWENSPLPAVSVPLADFFCHGLGRMATFENALFSSPEGRSFTSYIPMPFREAMRITVTNDSDTDLAMLFYEVNFTLHDELPDEILYFHSHWRRENPTTPRRDFEILPHVRGRGRYLGSCISVNASTEKWFRSWWGEGEVKVFLDGDTEHATLCGTGTEDYIGTGWGQGEFSHKYQGCPIADNDAFSYSFYRLHIPDPVWFSQEARITIQQIGCWSPNSILDLASRQEPLTLGDIPVDLEKAVKDASYGLFERQDDWASCAWFYLDQPQNSLPALPPPDVRTAIRQRIH